MMTTSPPSLAAKSELTASSFYLNKVKKRHQSVATYLFVRTVQCIIPKSYFCLLARAIIQIKSVIDPVRSPYWSQITDHLYVGAMPLQNWNHLEKIKELGIEAILSLNEDYEFDAYPFSHPVKPSQMERKVTFLRLPSPDLQPVKVSVIEEGVTYVAHQIQQLQKKVLIHCAAGRGRSVALTIAALVKIYGYSLDQAIDTVCQKRPQFMLGPSQLKSLIEWHQNKQPG